MPRIAYTISITASFGPEENDSQFCFPLLEEQANDVRTVEADARAEKAADAENPFSLPEAAGDNHETDSDEDSRWGGVE